MIRIFTLWYLSRTWVLRTRDTRNPHKHPGRQSEPTGFVIHRGQQTGPPKRPSQGPPNRKLLQLPELPSDFANPHPSRLENWSGYAGVLASQQAFCETSQRLATDSHAAFAPTKKPLPSISTAGGVRATSSTVTMGAFLSSSTWYWRDDACHCGVPTASSLSSDEHSESSS